MGQVQATNGNPYGLAATTTYSTLQDSISPKKMNDTSRSGAYSSVVVKTPIGDKYRSRGAYDNLSKSLIN